MYSCRIGSLHNSFAASESSDPEGRQARPSGHFISCPL